MPVLYCIAPLLQVCVQSRSEKTFCVVLSGLCLSLSPHLFADSYLGFHGGLKRWDALERAARAL